jgi:hypothetical protein
MAFFGLFKSKQEKALDQVLKIQTEVIFPFGAEDAQRDCDRVGELINWKIQGDELRGFVSGCKTLVAISESYDDDGFVESNIRRSKNRITPSQAREVYVYLAGESMMRTQLSRMAKAKGEKLSPEIEHELARYRMVWSVGTLSDTIQGGYGQYGLVASNPIPTVCVNGSNKYISRLRYKGQPIKHERLGSTSSDVTAGRVDIYNISTEFFAIGKIFICPYHKYDSKVAPAGYTFER